MSERLYLDRTIAPVRPVSPKAMRWLFGALAAANLAIAGLLFALHAFPVPIFLGLDFVGLGVAFAVINGRAQRGERVTVSAERVAVARASNTVWTSPTAFTRVEVEGEEAGPARVRLAISGRSFVVGSALAARDRRRFAQALVHAIGAARAERW